MNPDKKILRICAAALLCAVLVRFLDGYSLTDAQRSRVSAALVFLGTGRVVRMEDTVPMQQAEETLPAPTEPLPAVFSLEDRSLVEINDTIGAHPDAESLLLQPLNWKLCGEKPTVLILHTHASESYEKTENYTESSAYRTLDENYNVISVGDHLAETLSQQGIAVLQDKTLHDYPSYNGSYSNSRKTLAGYLQEYPSIQLVLDIHRDAMADSAGNQIGYTVSTEKGTAAKVMLVVGCNNPGWQENAALAVKLQAQLEKLCPGICRPMSLRKSRFNQDLSPGAILIEMGAAGNTRQEALLAAEYVAQAILALAGGTT